MQHTCRAVYERDEGTTLLRHTSLKVLTLTKGYIVAVCGYELIKWKKNCFFGTVSIHHWQNWHLQLSWGYNYQKRGLFSSFNMAYLRKTSMSCDFRLSSVEKKTLQKRRAITIFDQFRLLGNGLWIQLKMTARRANWRLFKPEFLKTELANIL